MKIDYAPYRLIGAWQREGALLRVAFEEGFGYADCHCWPELGDDPLETQLNKLRRGEYTPITRNALKAARAGLHLPDNIPLSHWLVTDASPPLNWSHYKVKLGTPFIVPPGAKVRLDCNERLSPAEAEALLKTLDPEQIDFVEDPCAYDPTVWARLKQYGIPLAADRSASFAHVADILVVKPAYHDIEQFYGVEKRLVVTSYLGHPLGQLYAAQCAAWLKADVSGLLSHHAYAPTAYSERLTQRGQTFTLAAPFTDLLEQEVWHEL